MSCSYLCLKDCLTNCPVTKTLERFLPKKWNGGQDDLKQREWVAVLQYFFDKAKFMWGYAEDDVHLVQLRAIIDELKTGGKL